MSLKPCTVTGCDRPHQAKGMCRLHYSRVRRNGDPHTVQKRGRKAKHVDIPQELRDAAAEYQWLKNHGLEVPHPVRHLRNEYQRAYGKAYRARRRG